MDSLRQQAERVRDCRAVIAQAQTALAAERTAWEEAHAVEIAALKSMQAELGEQEAQLRTMATLAYVPGGPKTLGCGIGIRETTKLEYSPALAFAWAQAHSMALALDIKAFEKIAMVQQMDFVEKKTVLTATIPTDLGKALEGVSA